MAYYIYPNSIPANDCKKYLEHCLDNVVFENSNDINRGLVDCFNKNIYTHNPEITDDPMIRKTSVGYIDTEHDPLNSIIWGYIRHANKQFFKYDLGSFQAIQFAKYQDGGFYPWHQDTLRTTKKQNTRKLSLTLTLSDEISYDGGLFQFYNGGGPVSDSSKLLSKKIKQVGTVIVFDSRDWHRVTPVTKGVRYSIVCWTVGPNFV